MTRTKYSMTLVMMLFFIMGSMASFAQMNSIYFIYGKSNDAKILLSEYMQPYTNILGTNINAGWYNTARVHQLGGLDVTAMVGLSLAPPESSQYDISLLTGLSSSFTGNGVAPTATGTLIDRPEVVFYGEVVNAEGALETHELARFTHQDGSGKAYVPMPLAQISIGVAFGTEISARFVPSTDFGFGSESGLWGVGAKHSVSQWIPIIKKLKFIDIAVQGGFTHATTSVHQSLPPISTLDPFPDFDWNDQFLVTDITGWTVNLIASQTLPIITLYEGIGYARSGAEISMIGHYPVNQVVADPLSSDFGITTYTITENPIEELILEGFSGIRINAGLRLKLGVFTLHYDFTRTLYSAHTAGIGFTFK